jgi:hypothetical protein
MAAITPVSVFMKPHTKKGMTISLELLDPTMPESSGWIFQLDFPIL